MTVNEWSVPESAVIERAGELLEADERAVLATIVDVEGSAYRRPGAKMVIPEDGGGIGSITAGCVEDEVLGLAQRVLDAGEPRLETFDLMGDDDIWGLGVGCNGIIDILLEPLDRYAPALSAYGDGDSIAALTVLESESGSVATGDRAFYRAELTAASGDWPGWLREAVTEQAASLAAARRADVLEVEGPDGDVTVFVDGLAPPPRLLVFGTGHDVGPVVELARQADFRVTVVGYRGANATEDRFPGAHEVVSTSPARFRERVEVDDETYAIVMTHNFVDDRLTLDALLDTPTPYVGLLGPRERFEEILEAFEEEGRTFEGSELDRIYTPAGLNLGGGAPYQIALSIVSEVLTVHNGRIPQHHTDRDGPIHDRL